MNEISKININGTSYNIVDTVTSINGKTGAISASDINAVLYEAGYDISGSAGYSAGTGISISDLNAISVSYGTTAGTACEGNDSRLSDSRPASDVSAWAKESSKPSYTLDEVSDGTNRKIPTKVSDLTNDSGFTTNTGTVTGITVGTTSYSPSSGVVTLPAYPSLEGYATTNWVNTTINDLVGINADGVSALAAVLSDNDATTGLLTLIAGKVDSNDSRLSDARPASDVYSWAKASTKPSYSYSEISNTPSSLPASDVYDWAKASSKPSYSYSEISGTPSSLPANGGNADTVDGYHADSFIIATRGTDGGQSGSGYIACMTNQNFDGSSKWWHKLSMDWTGNDTTSWISQLFLPTESGGVPKYRHNNSTGVDIINSTMHDFITDENIGSQSVNYASSAGNADTLDGYHYNNLPYLTAHQDISGKVDKVSSNRPGVTKLYRSESDDAYNVQTSWTGSYWYLRGYYGDTYHAGCQVDYAGSAGYAASAGSAPASDVYSWAKAASKPSYAYSEIGYGVNATSSAGGTLSLDGTTPLHVVTLTGNVSALTLSANPSAGHSCHVILTAAAEYTVAIAHDSTNRVCPEATDVSLTVPANGYVEIDFLNANSKIYVRGV